MISTQVERWKDRITVWGYLFTTKMRMYWCIMSSIMGLLKMAPKVRGYI